MIGNNPTISIIVPVYQAEKYLNRCIDSILNQSFRDFEVLLIDDGSTDTSGKICDNYLKDSRVKVFHRKNTGVSASRNYGIDHARGNYICFVDSDDWIESEMLLQLYQRIANKNEKLICCGYQRDFYKGDGVKRSVSILPDCKNIQTLQEFGNEFGQLYEKTIFIAVYGKLYVREVIEKARLRFDETRSLGEDMVFILEYLKYCENILFVNTPFYHYSCYQNNSLTKKFDLQKEENHRKLYNLSIDFCKEKDILNSAAPFITKSYLRGCFINVEQIFSKSFSLTRKEKKAYLNHIVNSKETKYAIRIEKPGDMEYNIYKMVMKTKNLTIVTLFSYARLLFKNLVRG